MRRFAYFGVAASQAMGSDFGEMPFQLRDEILAGKHPDAARFLTAGRGLSPLSEISPDNMRQAAFPVTTPEGARAAVQELVPRRVRLVKTWVDDRGGAVKKLTPDLYGAIIDEAHKNGLRVAVHATDLQDGQGPAARRHRRVRAHDQRRGRRAGRPVQAAPERRRCSRRSAARTGRCTPPGSTRFTRSSSRPCCPNRSSGCRAGFRRPIRSNGRNHKPPGIVWLAASRDCSAAGVKIGVGTDGGGQQGDQFIGWTMHAELENMVMAGIPPAQVLVAATRTSAEILGQDDLGHGGALARAPTSWCSTRIRSTTSRTRGGSPACTCAARA